jgi:Ser/Thr protein kinase RdoA (MazF antagonist)
MEKMIADIGEAERICEDLLEASERLFDLQIRQVKPIHQGWLNLKWRLDTNKGSFLLKQYNKERNKPSRLDGLFRALKMQQRLSFEGTACPRLLTASEGLEVIHRSAADEHFVVMEYVEGENIRPGKLNPQQMHSLGKATGYMHRLLNDEAGALTTENAAPQFLPPARKERRAHWLEMLNNAEASGKAHLRPYIEMQLHAAEVLTLDDLPWEETGWAHRDLWVDNLLFNGEELSALLDFDRLNVDYPLADIARAVISCALDDGVLNRSAAAAFVEGYRLERFLPSGALERSLRMLWYMESTWWVTLNMDEYSVPPNRFAEEMTWLAQHGLELPALLGDL